MHCQKCSIPIVDPQAVFCPRCGTRLQSPAVQPADAPSRGWEPTAQAPKAALNTQSPRVASGRDRDDVIRIALCTLIGAILLGWATYVTVDLDRIPGMMSSAFMVYQTDPAHFSYDFERVFHDSDDNAWLGVLFGSIIGAGLGWYLTRPKRAIGRQ